MYRSATIQHLEDLVSLIEVGHTINPIPVLQGEEASTPGTSRSRTRGVAEKAEDQEAAKYSGPKVR